MKKKGKKGLAVAMTLAVTMTSVVVKHFCNTYG